MRSTRSGAIVDAGNPPAAGQLIGISAMVGGCVLFGTNAVFAKLSYDAGAAVFGLMSLRYLIAAIIICPPAIHARRRDAAPLSLRSALLVTALFLASSTTYLAAIGLGPVSQVAPFLYLYPAILVFVGRIFFGEILDRRTVLAVALGICGSALLFDLKANGDAYLPGKALALLSAVLSAAFYTASSRLIPTRHSVQMVAITCIGGMFVFLPLALVSHADFALPEVVPYVIVMAVGGTAVGLALLQIGMRRLGATQASLLSLVEPVVTLSLAFILLDDSAQSVQLIGTLMVLSSFPLALVGRTPKPTALAEIR